MSFTLDDIAQLLQKHGITPELQGTRNLDLRGVNTLEDAESGEISFLSNPRYERMLQTTKASAVVLRADIAAPEHLALIQVKDPYAAITALIVEMHGYRQHPPVRPEAGEPNIHPTAEIGAEATIHPGVTIAADAVIGHHATIYPGCYVGPKCRIGDNLTLYPNVVVYEQTTIGDRVTVHAGTVIGNDGLGYAPVGGKWIKIPQIGTVDIGDDVEIGSNCSIDRATLGKTRIGSGSKLSNLIAVGHGAQIGTDCLIVAQVGLAGSVQIGNSVTLAGQAGVTGHIRIGNNATVGAKAGVTNNVSDGETVLGQPAIPINKMKRRLVHISRLPELYENVKSIEERLARIENNSPNEATSDDASNPASS